MDDPISALDSNVKHKIFEEVILGDLKNKTRILVTHAIDFLHLADRIVIIQNGNIKHVGKFKELESSSEVKQEIYSISKTYAKNQNNISDSEEILSKAGDYISKDASRFIQNENDEFVESN